MADTNVLSQVYKCDYIPIHPASLEGRVLGRFDVRGGMRRPRARDVTHVFAPGRPRFADRRHYQRLPSVTGRGGGEGRRNPPG